MATMLERLKGYQGVNLEDRKNGQEEDLFVATRPYRVVRLGHGHLKLKLLNQSTVVPLHTGFLVGRGTSCHLVLADPNASRVHASFVQAEQGWLLQDNASKNGTLLNGERITSAVLSSGDEIQIGQTVLVYEEI